MVVPVARDALLALAQHKEQTPHHSQTQRELSWRVVCQTVWNHGTAQACRSDDE